MPDNKLTDNDIKKALECCLSNEEGKCEECPLRRYHDEVFTCLSLKQEYALNLINRLQAENENYSKNNQTMTSDILKLYKELEQAKAENERLKEENENLRDSLVKKKFKDELFEMTLKEYTDGKIKEFAELVKKHSCFDHKDQRKVVAEIIIDHYLKKLVGDSK